MIKKKAMTKKFSSSLDIKEKFDLPRFPQGHCMFDHVSTSAWEGSESSVLGQDYQQRMKSQEKAKEKLENEIQSLENELLLEIESNVDYEALELEWIEVQKDTTTTLMDDYDYNQFCC